MVARECLLLCLLLGLTLTLMKCQMVEEDTPDDGPTMDFFDPDEYNEEYPDEEVFSEEVVEDDAMEDANSHYDPLEIFAQLKSRQVRASDEMADRNLTVFRRKSKRFARIPVIEVSLESSEYDDDVTPTKTPIAKTTKTSTVKRPVGVSSNHQGYRGVVALFAYAAIITYYVF